MSAMRLVVLTLVLSVTSAHADPARMVRTLERGVSLLGRSRSNQSLQVNAGRGGVLLRADGGLNGHGVIAVDGRRAGLFGGHTTAMFDLDANHRVSEQDRPQLAAALKAQAIDRASLVRGVRAGVLAHRAADRKLAAMDDKIDAILAESKGLRGSKSFHPRVSFQRGGPTGSMLIVNDGAMFLERNARGDFTLSPEERAEVAGALLR